jgi:hypothetical protein
VVRAAVEEGVDLLSLHLRRQTAASETAGKLTMGRFESLRDDFHSFLAGCGVPLSEAFRRDLFERPPVNRSSRSRFQDYYDPGLRDLIARQSAGLIARYGYAFDDAGDAPHRADPAAGGPQAEDAPRLG